MRKLAYLALLILACAAFQQPLFIFNKKPSGGSPTLALLQHPTASWGSSTSTVSITLTQSIGTGNALIFLDATSATANRISSINVGGTLVPCGSSGSCYQSGGHGFTVTDGGWVLSSTATAGPVVVTYSGGIGTGGVQMREYSCTGGTISADTAGTRDSSTDTTPFNGVTLTLAGTNDVIMGLSGGTSQDASAVNSPYGNFDSGWYDNINTSSGTAAVVTAAGNSGGSTTAAIALKCQ